MTQKDLENQFLDYFNTYYKEGGEELPKAQTGYGDILQYNQAMDIDYDPVKSRTAG